MTRARWIVFGVAGLACVAALVGALLLSGCA